ncbi:MAG TPA: hypothetical protein VGC06_30355 [Actinomycetes bacterium]
MWAPPPGPPRRPSPLRSLAMLLGVLLALVAVRWALTGALNRPLAPPGETSGRQRQASGADLAALRGTMLYLGGRQVLVADAGSATIAAIPAPGAGRVRVLRQGGFIVMFSRDGGVAVRRADGRSKQVLVREDAIDVLPSPDPGRVWVVTHDDGVPERAYRLHEIDLASAHQLRLWTLAYDTEPVAVLPGGVLVRDLQDGFELRDPHSRRGTALGRELTFLDSHGSLIAYLDDRRLHLRDLASGSDRTVPPPAGARSWFALGPPLPGTGCCQQLGAFSPDGGTLAVYTALAGPGEPGLTVVDVASARAEVLPGSEGATPVACQPCLGWSRSGWLFFFNGGPALADPAAWRPGRASAIPLALDLHDVTTVLPSGIAPA